MEKSLWEFLKGFFIVTKVVGPLCRRIYES